MPQRDPPDTPNLLLPPPALDPAPAPTLPTSIEMPGQSCQQSMSLMFWLWVSLHGFRCFINLFVNLTVFFIYRFRCSFWR